MWLFKSHMRILTTKRLGHLSNRGNVTSLATQRSGYLPHRGQVTCTQRQGHIPHRVQVTHHSVARSFIKQRPGL